ncbi:MAG: hypothetical protein PHU06_12470 [Gallionella sp.]|nr:hypothetical protein [Gallionella sp.]MDD4959405.1 hypothetical protein [Gallionella sp.]
MSEVILEAVTPPKKSDVVASLGAICDALSNLPKVGPISAMASGAFKIIGLITNNSDPSLADAIVEITNIIKNELTRSNMSEQLGHIETWATRLSSLHGGLKQLEESGLDPTVYLENVYLHDIKEQLVGSGGTVPDAVHLLAKLWGNTPWREMDLLEDILKALALGLGYEMMLYRDQYLIQCHLSAFYQTTDPDKANVHKTLATAAYGEYKTRISGNSNTLITPNGTISAINEWAWNRGYGYDRYRHAPCASSLTGQPSERPYCVSTKCKDSCVCLTFVVYDLGRNDKEYVYCDWANHSSANDWVLWRLSTYHQSVISEIDMNLMPLKADCQMMIDSFKAIVLDS